MQVCNLLFVAFRPFSIDPRYNVIHVDHHHVFQFDAENWHITRIAIVVYRRTIALSLLPPPNSAGGDCLLLPDLNWIVSWMTHSHHSWKTFDLRASHEKFERWMKNELFEYMTSTANLLQYIIYC
jgi:hypothetical protein